MAVHTGSRRKLDLMGQRFGSLTVVAPAENIGSRTAWLCRCDCGKELVVKTVSLREGKSVSCGCLARPRGLQSMTFVDGTYVEMLRGNQTPRKNNTSGVPGVDWIKKKHRWRATICFKGKRHYLGSHRDFEDTVRARKEAEAELIEPLLAQYPEKGRGH